MVSGGNRKNNGFKTTLYIRLLKLSNQDKKKTYTALFIDKNYKEIEILSLISTC
jgi:hypothetical protein